MLWSNDVLTRTVTGSYISANGNPAQGKISFRPTARILDEGDTIILNTASIVVTLDTNGAFTLELPVTDNTLLKPKEWAYEVTARIYGSQQVKFYMQLPYGEGTPVNLVNLMSAGTSSTTVGTFSSQTAFRGPVGLTGATGPMGPRQSVSDTPPATPALGDQWLNSNTARQYVWYDGYWVEIGAALRGSPAVYIQATQPVTSEPTYMWVDTSQSSLTIWIEDGT
jgi:hypothetical protein